MKKKIATSYYRWKANILGNYNKNRLVNKFVNKNAHQYNNTTDYDRYPEIFNEAIVLNNGKNENLEILSFGCSTGEECHTISEYFPQSSITGVDINLMNLKKAKSEYGNSKRLNFMNSDEFEGQKGKKFDIIFCMSVLCRWEDTKDISNCNDVYPFEVFQNLLKDLDKRLNQGGMFVIYNSNYCFSNTNLFENYEVVSSPIKDSGFVHKYNADGQRNYEVNSNIFFKKKA